MIELLTLAHKSDWIKWDPEGVSEVRNQSDFLINQAQGVVRIPSGRRKQKDVDAHVYFFTYRVKLIYCLFCSLSGPDCR